MVNDFSGDLTIRSAGSSAFFPDIPRPILSAIHQTVIGKTDSLEVYHYRLIGLETEDLRQIEAMLQQWCRQYNVQSIVMQVFAENRHVASEAVTSRKAFQSIDEYVRIDSNNSEPVRLFTLRLSLILRNPNTDSIESYTVSLEFPEWVDWRPDILEGKVDRRFSQFSKEAHSLKIRIEYSDYVTAVSLSSMIESWYKGISATGRQFEVARPSPWQIVLRFSVYSAFSPGRYICFWLPLLASVSFFIPLQRLVEHLLPQSNYIIHFAMLCTLICWAFLDFVMRITLEKFDRTTFGARTPSLRLNSGNIKIFDEHVKDVNESHRTRRKVSVRFFCGVASTLVLSILANYISAKLF